MDLNVRDDDRSTALILAVIAGKTKCASLLLEAGAAPDATTNKGWTALMYAAHNGDMDLANLLLEHGANKEEQISLYDQKTGVAYRLSATQIAANGGYDGLARILEWRTGRLWSGASRAAAPA